MTFQEKIDAMIEDLQEKGVKKRVAAPLIYRFLWKLNIKVRPPLFLESILDYSVMIIVNLLFYIISVNFLLFLYGLTGFADFPNMLTFKISILAGGFTILVILVQSKHRAKKLNLPEWEEYINQIENKNKNENS